MESKHYHVIPHTHWDFEWYFTSNESLVQLVYHMDDVMRALEQGLLECYLLDGQLSIVEDYLTQCPEQAMRVQALVEAGKLRIGPWYTQTDLLIIRGESVLRNLNLGIRAAAKLGGHMLIGYVPDCFGQAADMPAIYNGLGIDKTVFWRGVSRATACQREFYWQGEDGSRVLCYNIKNGYYHGGPFVEEENISPLLAMLSQDCASNHVALPLGGDQRAVDFNTQAVIDKHNARMEGTTLRQSSYEALFEAILGEEPSLPTIEGEQIDGEVSKIHRSIYSSRYDHKYLNDKIERRLIYQLEPLCALAKQLGIEYKGAMLDNIWRVLLRNHAHDSAGGCNSDKTNRGIVQRFEQADQLSYSTLDYLLRKIAISQPTPINQINLYNTLAHVRERVLEFEVSTKSSSFFLFDAKGKELTYQLLAQHKENNGSIKRDPKDNDPAHDYVISRIACRVDLPALSVTGITLREHSSSQVVISPWLQSNAGQIDNDRLRLIFDDGRLNLFDKKNNELWSDFLSIADCGDDGDNYDYSPPDADWRLRLGFDGAEVTQQSGELCEKLCLKGRWLLPENLQERVQRECTASLDYRIEFILHKPSGDLELRSWIDNRARDHRMQLVVRSPIVSTHSFADTLFGSVSRPHRQNELANWRELGWKEEPSAIYPLLQTVNLHDDRCSLSVLAKGIKEYEILSEDGRELGLTLFRSVGWLGKPELTRRPGIASGQQFKYIPTPDSQLQQRLHFKLCFVVDDQYRPANVLRSWQDYAVGVPCYQKQNLNQFTNTLQYFQSHPLPVELPSQYELLSLKAEDLVVSSIKLNHEGSALVVRVYNPSSQVLDAGGRISFNQPIKAAVESNLLEQAIEPVVIDNQSFDFGVFAPKQIKTFCIELK